MKYEIAELVVEFEPRFNTLRERADKYKVEESRKRNFRMRVTDEHIQKEKLSDPEMSSDLAEYMIMGTTFYKALVDYNGCLLHSSAVVVEDEAFLFSANSGTGKSTHTSLWLKYLVDQNPYILNDDKPAIRIMEDGIFAYGTPFSGKHDMSENKKVKLKAICFLEQSKINFIRKVEPKEAVNLFLEQTIRKLKEEEMLKLFDILDILLNEIPVYKLYCDRSEEAVKLSYQTMKGERNED